MTDDHPMHSWDAETRAAVDAHLQYVIADIAPRLEAARATVQDVERRLAAGEPVGQTERVAAHAAYREQLDAHETAHGQLRTLQVRTVDSSDQRIGD